jgi:CubicO group peptidase (beta-lactamase class C family)
MNPRIIIKSIFLFICLFAFAGKTFLKAQPKEYSPAVFTDADREKKIAALYPLVEALYQDYAEKNHIPGYSFGIVLDGKLVYAGAGGYIDLEKKIPATPKSMFRIASMSKSFTAMAILKLRDENKVKLDEPIKTYLPEMKGQQLTADAPLITVRHLLTHSAGFPEDNPWGDRQLAVTEDDFQDMLEGGISFSNVPGVTYEYSNMGFAMLGMIIKQQTLTHYSDYIAKHIWKPLGMTDAEWEYTKVPANVLAKGYRWLDNKYVEQPMLHDGIYGAMGGMLVSIESFAKYVALHQQAWPARNDAENGIIKRSSIREMHQPWRISGLNANYKYPSGRPSPLATAYAYGLRWSRDGEGRETIGHTGGLPGFGSNWQILPDYGIGVMFFANATYAPTSLANTMVLDTLVRLSGIQSRQLPASKTLTQRRDQLVKLLPDFNGAQKSGIFAVNFFMDYFVEPMQKEAREIFAKAGKTISVGEVVPENQLRGYFDIKAEHGTIRVSFTLSPEKEPKIQEYHIKLL